MNRVNDDHDDLLPMKVDVELENRSSLLHSYQSLSIIDRFQYYKSKYYCQYILLRNIIIFLIFMVLSLTAFYFALADSHLPTHYVTNPEPTYGTQITLFGDSLIHRSYVYLDFSGLLRKSLKIMKTESVIFNDEGQNGNTIYDLSNRVDDALSSHNASGLIFLWNSDCSDSKEEAMTYNEKIQFRINYEKELRSVLDRIIIANKTSIIALAGPSLLGESSRYQKKEAKLNAYRQMNIKITNEYNITYIDVRTALQKAIPSYWIFNRGYVTIDGEHLNNRGTLIVSQLLAAAIDNWWLKRQHIH